MNPELRFWNYVILSTVDQSLKVPKQIKKTMKYQYASEVKRSNQDIINAREYLMNCREEWATFIGTDYDKFKETIGRMWDRVDKDPSKSLDYRKRISPLKGTGRQSETRS